MLILLAYLALAFISGLAFGYSYGCYRYSADQREARIQRRLRNSPEYAVYWMPDDPGYYWQGAPPSRRNDLGYFHQIDV